MPVQRLNHAVLYVRDVERSVAFYRDVLGFAGRCDGAPGRGVPAGRRARTNDHDLGLFEIGAEAGRLAAPAARTVGLYHLAWEVDTLDELERIAAALGRRGALVGASDHGTTKALYAHDPDGLEFEVSWLVPGRPAHRRRLAGVPASRPLDLAREKERYGAQTRGGVGISVPAAG